MLLRPRQKTFVERSVRALDEHGNTLGVAPTGSGKTLMLSGVVGQMLAGSDAKACVLAHRDELTAQNVLKFAKVNPSLSTSIVDSRTKSWRGRATFAMVPTLARAANLEAMPALDLVVVDEAHHAAADSYRRIIDRARECNPDVRIYGVTATPKPRRPQGPPAGVLQCRRSDPARRTDRLGPPGAAAHLRHRRRHPGGTQAGSEDRRTIST